MICLHCHRSGVPTLAELCPGCGVYLPSLLRDVLPPSKILRNGGYRIDYALGRGGFGITYRAVHLQLDRFVAIKEFFPQEHAVRNGVTGSISVSASKKNQYERWLQRFVQEGRTLAKISHPNVVRVKDLFEESGTAYLVMELVDGRNLKQELESREERGFPAETVREIGEQLVEALSVLHSQKIFHLDIKPDNVLLTPDGRAVLVDFGSARQGFDRQTTRAFTAEYVAPEVLVGDDVGPESDIFELGMLIHELLTGALPPSGLSRLLKDSWKPTLIDEPWASLVASALRIRREDRPRNVKEWWRDASEIARSILAEVRAEILSNGSPTSALQTPRQQVSARPGKKRTNSLGMVLVRIEAGEFMMGSPESEEDADDEKPLHRVRITRPFYLGKYEVTQAEYEAVMGENPGEFEGKPKNPVESVSWFDAVRFCNQLSEREGLKPFYEISGATVQVPDWNGTGYRLPTEAEWEYACRAGTTTRFCCGDDDDDLGEFAWFAGDGDDETHEVGQKRPNAFGLYDMHGNVWEWCWDWYSRDYYEDEESPVDDPRGPSQASYRVFRGGGWLNDARFCRPAYRRRDAPENRNDCLGFRVAAAQE